MGNNTENTTEKSLQGEEAGAVKEAGLLYKTLTSRWASAIILSVMAAFFIATAVLGDGGHGAGYSLAGEKLIVFPGSPSLPVFFSTPVIILLSAALYVTLASGVYDTFWGRGSMKKSSGDIAPTHTISLTQNEAEASVDARRVLTDNLGLRVKGEKGGWVVLEKGPSYKYLLWAYFAGTAFFLAAVALSNVSAFDKTVTLTRGRPADVETAAAPKFRLEAGRFTVRHTGIRTSADPDRLVQKLTRLLERQGPVFEVIDGKLYPLDWSLEVSVQDSGGKAIKRFISDGETLKHQGLTFRLDSIEQTFRLRVDDNPLLLNARGGEELVIPGLGPGLGLPVRFTPYMGGVLEKSDGTTEEMPPHTRLKLSGSEGEELGSLEPGKSIYINGVRLTLVDVVEKSVLGYTHDPGFPLLMLGIIILLGAAAFRIFGFWQTAAYRIDSSSPIVRLQIHVKSRGLFASSERFVKKLTGILTAEDIRPIPIPGERLK